MGCTMTRRTLWVGFFCAVLVLTAMGLVYQPSHQETVPRPVLPPEHVKPNPLAVPPRPSTPSDRPSTPPRIDLQLVGLVFGTEQDSVAVLMSADLQQQTYQQGQKIQGLNAVLSEILPDRVKIISAGQEVELPLRQAPVLATAERPESPTTEPLRPETLNVLNNIFNSQSYQENGTFQGYRISPAGDSAHFLQLGLQSGDVIKDINGISLSQENLPASALAPLAVSASLILTIDRNGELVTVYLDNPSRH